MNDAKAANDGAIKLKPNKPEPYNGKRDFLVVNTWIYKLEQYMLLLQVNNPTQPLSEANKIMFASTFLTGTASVWWFTLVQSNAMPTTWEDFKATLSREFVPEDHVRRAREKLRRLRQIGSVSKYLGDFRNLTLVISDMSGGEKMDRFVEGLKREIQVEVLKSTARDFEEAARIALRVDGVMWRSSNQNRANVSGTGQSDGPVPMELGNVETNDTQRKKGESQRQRDIRVNACFTCHSVGCRPHKCKRRSEANNLEAALDSFQSENANDSDSDSENSEN